MRVSDKRRDAYIFEMDRIVFAAPGWRYWPSPVEGLLEIGALHGAAGGLATHFHDELQITFVMTGRRLMRIGGHLREIEAGRCACIPAGTPHSGTAESPDVTGLLAYAAAADYDLEGLTADIEALWQHAGDLPWPALAAIVARRRRGDVPRNAITEPFRARMSREGHSRRFTRETGMPPHAFAVASRLNKARHLLRAGTPIAEVAAATRFADQSHLGRCFRRAFGVTPGVYGRGYRMVTNVPDV